MAFKNVDNFTYPTFPMSTASKRGKGSHTRDKIYCVKPGVHTNDFVPIYFRRGPKLGHASLATVFRPSLLIFQPILRENLESPVVRYRPITTAVIPDACHGAYISPKEDSLRDSLGLDRVVTMCMVQSAQ